MTGFGMANMDYTPVKFMIKIFEANYPESLGHICVHRAPWIFNTIWGVIKGWLDPVVASKISFTKDEKDLAAYIPPENIPKELGGKDDWEYEYVEPAPAEAAQIASASSSPVYQAVKAERAELVAQFETLTLQWVRNEGGPEVAAQRQRIAAQMQANYWKLDPFVRAPSLYDRTGVIAPGGKINMYPERSGKATNGAPPAIAPAPVDGADADKSAAPTKPHTTEGAGFPAAAVAGAGAGAGVAGIGAGVAGLKVADADDGASIRQSFETARESWD